MSTLQKHYDRLRQDDPKRWNAMNGQLASRFHVRSNCLTYFVRSILEKEEKSVDAIDLSMLPAWIAKQCVEYMDFTWDDIWNNTIPELAEPADKVAAL